MNTKTLIGCGIVLGGIAAAIVCGVNCVSNYKKEKAKLDEEYKSRLLNAMESAAGARAVMRDYFPYLK